MSSANSTSTGLKPSIEAQLHRIAVDNGFVDYTFESECGSKRGDGFAATMVRVQIQGKDKVSGAPKSLPLICKVLSDNEDRRKLFSNQQAHEREAYVYNELLPDLVRFQQEKGVSAADGFYQTPKCLLAMCDATTNVYVIVLEDMCAWGYEMWDKFIDIPYEKVRLVFETLGRFHGVSYAFKDQQPDVFAKHKAQMFEMIIHMLENSPGMKQLMEDPVERLYDKGTNEYRYLKQLREKKSQHWYDTLNAGASKFETFGHGDYWSNNMLYKDNANSPTEISIIDWQIARVGTPILDILHFTYTALKKSFRDEHFFDLLRHYHDTLTSVMVKCGSSPDLFTYEDLSSEFKRFSAFPISMTLTMLKVFISDPRHIVEMDSYALDLTDMETGKPKPIFNLPSTTEQLYKQRLADNLNDAAEYGWIEWPESD